MAEKDIGSKQQKALSNIWINLTEPTKINGG
jgi:hypothetical protein